MDLNSTRIFVNVVIKGSFSAAASFMAVPVATVSRRIASLESALGVRLLERSTRKLRLTEAGA
ncbi:Transcriptional regulator, LysR family, partial [hydrothermal vent metagenome]